MQEDVCIKSRWKWQSSQLHIMTTEVINGFNWDLMYVYDDPDFCTETLQPVWLHVPACMYVPHSHFNSNSFKVPNELFHVHWFVFTIMWKKKNYLYIWKFHYFFYINFSQPWMTAWTSELKQMTAWRNAARVCLILVPVNTKRIAQDWKTNACTSVTTLTERG